MIGNESTVGIKQQPEVFSLSAGTECNTVSISCGAITLPRHELLLTAQLRQYLQELASHTSAPGPWPATLTSDQLDTIRQMANPQALRQEFTTDALNLVNRAVYAEKGPLIPLDYDDYFLRSPIALNYISRLMTTAHQKNGQAVAGSLLILASGDYLPRFDLLAPGLATAFRQLDVTLSDFIRPSIPRDMSAAGVNVGFRSTSIDLLNPLPVLPAQERSQTALITYGFDSVYGPGDETLVFNGSDWFIKTFRPYVDTGDPRRDAWIRQRLQQGQALNAAYAYDEIKQEVYYQRLDIAEHEFGASIIKLYSEAISAGKPAVVVVPGNAIRVVSESFGKIIHPDGQFIIGEIGLLQPCNRGEGSVYGNTARGARYKAEDYALFAEVMRSRGFIVDLQSIGEIATDYQPGGIYYESMRTWLAGSSWHNCFATGQDLDAFLQELSEAGSESSDHTLIATVRQSLE